MPIKSISVFYFSEQRLFLVTRGSFLVSNFLPAASVRAFAVFAGPVPPELTADTSMTYMVYTVRFVNVVVFVVYFKLTILISLSKSSG